MYHPSKFWRCIIFCAILTYFFPCPLYFLAQCWIIVNLLWQICETWVKGYLLHISYLSNTLFVLFFFTSKAFFQEKDKNMTMLLHNLDNPHRRDTGKHLVLLDNKKYHLHEDRGMKMKWYPLTIMLLFSITRSTL